MATGGDDSDSTQDYWQEMKKELDEQNTEGQKRMFTRAQMREAQVSKK